MKITLKYEEADDTALHLTLRLTLPAKYVNGTTQAVVKLFVDHYNKKHPENTLDHETLHLKVVGGEHLPHSAQVSDTLRNGEECYLLGEDALMGRSEPRPEPAPVPAAPTPAPSVPKASRKDEGGKVRCKRFGCNRYYDPEGPPQECVHHKAPPIFHETAKFWSCCKDRKAYDWDTFMSIPGCEKSFCSDSPEGQQNQKKFLGGTDLRGDSAPVRLDANAPKDPRHKLTDLRKGLIAIGVDEELFDKLWGRLAAETDDPEKVCEIFRTRFAAILNAAN
eukprot:TRINITY_DN50849_c0_g1_i1.p1 TRINITY_DN50849_c0_g1~~TRINITY_DN50849_c0_g1_i1.p1  ORF type:complete len:278 (-),score=44.92 TRINITY_DN50849_c0_g1_i1:126-959(-)